MAGHKHTQTLNRFEWPRRKESQRWCTGMAFFSWAHNFRTYSLRIFEMTLICHWQTTKPNPHIGARTGSSRYTIQFIYTCSTSSGSNCGATKKIAWLNQFHSHVFAKPFDALFVRSITMPAIDIEKKNVQRREREGVRWKAHNESREREKMY